MGRTPRHNTVDGLSASRYLLACIRQRVLSPDMRAQLVAKLRAIAERERATEPAESVVATRQAKLADLRRKRELAAKNLALAESGEQRRAVAAVVDELVSEENALEARLRQAAANGPTRDIDAEVASALGVLDRLGELATEPTNLESIGTLFALANARLFLRFEEAQLKKRKVNKVSGGVVTFGSSPPPVTLSRARRDAGLFRAG